MISSWPYWRMNGKILVNSLKKSNGSICRQHMLYIKQQGEALCAWKNNSEIARRLTDILLKEKQITPEEKLRLVMMIEKGGGES